MKRIVFFLIFILFLFTPMPKVYGEIPDEKPADVFEGEVIKLEDVNENTLFNEVITKEEPQSTTLKSNIQKYYTFDKGLLKLHFNQYINFDFGAIGTVSWLVNQQTGDLNTNFKFNTTDIILSGKVNDYIDYKAQMFAERNIDEQTILGDLFVRGKYKNITAQVGRMRKPFAYEPTFSLYDLDFAVRSQIGSLFKDHRDTGGKVIVTSKYADLGLGLFASMQDRPFNFSEHGIEFDTSLTLKPFANLKNKGDLKLIGSIATGKRDRSYNNYSGVISYAYKKFAILSEFISKEAAFNSEKNANGFYVKSSYFITDKLQATLRFDRYNPDVNNGGVCSNEYVAGLNYYLNNKNTMFVLNYVFHDGEIKSHKVALQMRYRTW